MELRMRWHSSSWVWSILSAAALIMTISFVYQFITKKNSVVESARLEAQLSAQQAAQKINTFISILQPIAQSIADELSEKQLNADQIEELLKSKKPVEISGLGVAFLPNAFSAEKKLYAPYYLEKDGTQQLIRLEDLYDYSSSENSWLYDAINQGSMFAEPYFGSASNTILIEYVAPIYRTVKGEQVAVGIVYANQSVEHLKHILTTLFLNDAGYWAILSNTGTYLAHPLDQLVQKQTSIFDLAKQIKNDSLAQAGKKILEKEHIFLEYENEITGASSWLFTEPIEGTNWTIAGIFDKAELPIDPLILRKQLINPSIYLALFLIFFVFLLLSLLKERMTPHWWIASGLISLALVAQIGWTWYATFSYPDFRKDEKSYIVENKANLYNYIKEAIQPYRYGQPSSEPAAPRSMQEALTARQDSRFIPTGIYVNNVQFRGINEIQISAYVWQRFTNGIHDAVPRGFIFPQATESVITEISRIKDSTTETIMWEVYAKLNQFFLFEDYPFDSKSLRIQFWHRHIKKNIVLIPDLDSYQLINPRSLPGIDDEAYLPGWQIVASHFGYKKENYSTNFGAYATGPFGIYKSIDKSEAPELFFDILIKRNIIDSLTSDLLPVTVIAFLLFVILLTSVRLGYGVIASCASVFFGTVFAHMRFREKVPHSQVVYFENFFFLMYAFIILVLLATILYQQEFNIPFIRYKRNLFLKVCYFPFLFGLISLITLRYLY